MFVRRALLGEPIEIFGDGTQRRDCLHVDDVLTRTRRSRRHPTRSGTSSTSATPRRTPSPRSRRRSRPPPAAQPECDSSNGPAIWQRIDIGSFHTGSARIAAALGWRATVDLARRVRVTPSPSTGSTRGTCRRPEPPRSTLRRRAFAEVTERIARRGSYLLGPELESFEQELAAWIGAAARRRCGVGRVGAAAGACRGGYRPRRRGARAGVHRRSHRVGGRCHRRDTRAVDVDPATACLTPAAIEGATTPRTRGVIVVHLYGFPAELPPRGSELIVIEDAAQATRGARQSRPGARVAYCFYPTKNLGGIGDGGAVVTNDADARRRGPPAASPRTEQRNTCTRSSRRTSACRRSRLRGCASDLPALAGDVDARRAIAARYRAAAPSAVLAAPTHPRHAYHLCVFRSADRDAVRAAPRRGGRRDGSPLPAGAHAAARVSRPVPDSPCPEAEAWAAECVSRAVLPGDDRSRDRARRRRAGRAGAGGLT